MKRYIALVATMMCAVALMAQKPKQATEFSAAGLPDELQEWINKSTNDSEPWTTACRSA